ncbi:hypothetical protein [Coleofasciculus sp. FACHB-SPT36]|nr:hypothetical protein [Coleofasciculus sp. FACHB-SPT36]
MPVRIEGILRISWRSQAQAPAMMTNEDFGYSQIESIATEEF